MRKLLLMLCFLALTANFSFAQVSKTKPISGGKSSAVASDSVNAYRDNPALINAAKLVEAERAKKKPLVGKVARYAEIAGAEESRKDFVSSGLDKNEQNRRQVYTELLSRDYIDAFASNTSLTDRAVILPLKVRFVSVDEFSETFVEGRTLLYKKDGKTAKKESSIEVIREYTDNTLNEGYWKIINNVLATIIIDDKTALILERIVHNQKGDLPDTYRTVILFKDSGKLMEYQDKTENQIIVDNPSNILWNKPYGDSYSEMIKKLKENGIRQY